MSNYDPYMLTATAPCPVTERISSPKQTPLKIKKKKGATLLALASIQAPQFSPAPRNLDEIRDIKKLEYESLPQGIYETPALKNPGIPGFVTPAVPQRRLLSAM